MNKSIIKICKVLSVKDPTSGGRIKVAFNLSDENRPIEDVEWVLPFMPKMIQVKPKVGEAVLVIIPDDDNEFVDKYYIGPVISQPNMMYNEVMGPSALSLYKGSHKVPSKDPLASPESAGAMAEDDSIAIYGRKFGDIIISDNDVYVRCGSRKTGSDGSIVYNRSTPSLINLKYNSSGDTGKKSSATIVADKVNIVSNNAFGLNRPGAKEGAVTEETLEKLYREAHALPYGDLLVDFLKKFVSAFANHTHPYPGMKPCNTSEMKDITDYDVDSVLSKDIKIL